MTSYERIAAAMTGGKPDRVPVYPILSGVTRNLVNADYKTWSTDASVYAKAQSEAARQFDLDCICTLIDLSVEAADFGQEIIYPENEAAHPNYKNQFLGSLEDYRKLQKIDPRTTPRMSMHIEACRLLSAEFKNDKPLIAFVFGPLGTLSMLRNQQELYYDLYDDPDTVHAGVDLITDVLIDYCDALMEAGADAIMLDTLFASKSIMQKEMWMEFEGYAVRKIADFIHSKGRMVMIHNCGLGIYFDEQIETMKPEAISFLHVPDGCSSYADCKQKYGGKTMLIGCVPPTEMPAMTTEQLTKICREQIDTFAAGGNYILATGCEYPCNLSFDHARTMVEIAKTYGKYE